MIFLKRLDWITFLNESCTWEFKEQAEAFLSEALQSPCRLTGEDVTELSQAETYMREQLNALHFGRALDFAYLNERLNKIHLHLQPISKTISGEMSSRLPALRATAGKPESSIQSLIDTLLFQFAHFLGETLDGEAPYKVNRCEAVCRKKSVDDCKSFYEKFRSLETSWKNEVITGLSRGEEIERCADFFVANHGGKFCSDSCRFNSFALRKQMQSPSYQAEKQRRYRERQKSRELSEL